MLQWEQMPGQVGAGAQVGEGPQVEAGPARFKFNGPPIFTLVPKSGPPIQG